MKKKLVLIVPYFGTLPDYAYLFFETLKYNPEIDLFLVTDQEVDLDNKNIILKKMSFRNFKNMIQDLFDFQISLETPYKLCDYKPTYGLLFEREIQDYRFWGYCDLDMILGDVLSFLSEQTLLKYEKFYQFGHMTIFKNTNTNNRVFMTEAGMDYKDVFTTPIIKVFDEVIGIQKKYELLGIPTYLSRDCADIDPWKYQFYRVENHLTKERLSNFNFKKQIFFWEKGKVYRAYYNSISKSIEYDQFNYLHFQKRNLKIKIKTNNPSSFFITNKGFIEKEIGFNVTLDQINQFNQYSVYKEFEIKLNYFKFIWIRRFRKYILKR